MLKKITKTLQACGILVPSSTTWPILSKRTKCWIKEGTLELGITLHVIKAPWTLK